MISAAPFRTGNSASAAADFDTTTPTWRRSEWYVGVIASVLFLFGLFVVSEFTADDAYISFRYARHLAEGDGLVWNPGGRRIEGFTSMLWVVLMAIPEAAALRTDVVAAVVGSIALAVACFLAYRTAARLGAGSVSGSVAVAAILLNLSSYLHAVSGLETALYGMVLLATFIVGLAGAVPSSGLRAARWLPVLTFVLGLIRPEGVLAGSAAMAFVFARRPSVRSTLFRGAAIAGACGLIYLAWRAWYFSAPLPIPFYFKVGHEGVNVVRIGRLLWAWLPTAVGALLAVRVRPDLRPVAMYTALFSFAAVLVYVVASNEMDYANRFLWPTFFPVIVLLGVSAGTLFQRSILVGAAAALCGLVPFVTRPEYRVLNYGPNLRAAHAELGRRLRDAPVPRPARTLALSDAGALAYFSEWRVFDYSGLNEPRITIQGADATSLLLAQRPTLVVFPSSDGRSPVPVSFHVKTGDVAPFYDLLGAVKFNRENYLLVYVRNDVDPAIRDALAGPVRDVVRSSHELNPSFDSEAQRIEYVIQRWRERLGSWFGS